MVALKRPIVEIIGARQLRDVVVQLIGAGEAGRLAGHDGVGISAARDFTAAAPHAHIGDIPGAVHVDPVFAGALQVERQIGSVHFDQIAVIEMAHSQHQSAFRQAELHGAIVEIEHGHAGFRGQSYGGRAHMQLGARVLVGP